MCQGRWPKWSCKILCHLYFNNMEIWNTTKNGILKAAKKVCGKTRKRQWCKESWWWTDHASQAVEAKRRAYRAWKKGGSREEYNNAKRLAKLAVYQAKQEASLADFSDIAKQMMRENQDVMGEKCVKNDEGELALTPEAKKAAWKQHYEGLQRWIPMEPWGTLWGTPYPRPSFADHPRHGSKSNQ